MADFLAEKARIGDRVFCAFGSDVKIGETNATIISINIAVIYPIEIKTDNILLGHFSFTKNGYHIPNSGMPSLFWSKPEYTDPPAPKRKIKKYIAGFYYTDNEIWARGNCEKMRLFNSPAEAGDLEGHKIAFISEVEVEEDF